jgi:hypothetical protein
MTIATRALMLFLLGLMVAGCFGSGGNTKRQAAASVAIRATMASVYGSGFADLFPKREGSVSCAIPLGGPGIVYIPGKCATVVTLVAGGSAHVKFVETWDGRTFNGPGSKARPGLSFTWEFSVSPSRRVSRPRRYGDFPPQSVV